MANYRLELSEPVSEGIRRVVNEQAEAAIAHLEGNADPHDAVHEVRKRCKKIRAGLRLARGALGGQYSKENRCYRDIARELSLLRDEEAMLETLGDLADDDLPLATDRLASVRAELRSRRDRRLEALRTDAAFVRLSASLRGAQQRIHQWHFAISGFDALAPGLARVYRRGRKGLRKARDSCRTADLHDWRKRTKYLRHQLQLLRPACPRMIEAQADLLHELTGHLGFDHDVAMLGDTILDTPMVPADSSEGMRLRAFLDERRERARGMLWSLGERAYAEKVDDFVDRIRAYWFATASGAAPANPTA